MEEGWRKVAEHLVWSAVRIDAATESAEDEATIYLYHDDVTPDYYVILVLQTVFQLSHELAEHITWVAHEMGTAAVLTRPRREAERLVNEANMAVELDGFPLTFGLELQEQACDVEESSPRFVHQIVLSLILLLSGVSVAVADNAGVF